jgi:hypothetical protein
LIRKRLRQQINLLRCSSSSSGKHTNFKGKGKYMNMGFVSSLAILLIASSSFSQCTNYEKYNANKKSVVGAAVLQFFIPGAGNAYAKENLIKVIAYPTLFVGFAATAAIGSTIAKTNDDKALWLFIGGIGGVLTHFIGIADASIGCVDYNEKLRRKYDLVVNDKGLQIVYKF